MSEDLFDKDSVSCAVYAFNKGINFLIKEKHIDIPIVNFAA